MTTAAAAFLGVERSVSGRRWVARPGDPPQAAAHAQRLGLPEAVARILVARGVDSDLAERYLEPRLRDWLPDPSRLRDMEPAAERLAQAILKGEGIGILGDYDVDGATSTAVLTRFLRAMGCEPLIHIPDRQREGYGPNGPAMESLRARGARVVITVDCGTLAYAALDVAQGLGLDVLVVDHHLAEPALPAALAVVNPNRLDESGEFGMLAAVGCAFLLVVATTRALRQTGAFATRPEPALLDLLDLVALGTVCDVVPMTGVNRALVGQGLRVLGRRGNVGLCALADAAGMTARPMAYHLGYILGPRVNAGGRVGKSDLGARLLSTDDPAEAAAIAEQLCHLNRERQAIEAEVEAQALGAVAGLDDAVAVIAGQAWHPGVIGIVAGRLKDKLRRPVIVIGLDGKSGKGSGRSIAGVDLGAAVVAAHQSGLLLAGGGHAMAAGLSIAAEQVGPFRAFMNDRLGPAVSAQADREALGIDAAVAVGGATLELAELMERAGPYGPGNPKPRLALSDARVIWRDVVGEKHVRTEFAAADGARLKAIAFRAVDTPLGEALLKSNGAPMHVAGELSVDEWRGERRAQFSIDDVAPVGLSQPRA
ncbi:MAG: single-stranded-DNA-specific exonuclease RecJ [Hyphomicrobium sp.]|nr:single-stranded-DNA-specific exonuclease RecJ [Hyphomicrobium sp.]